MRISIITVCKNPGEQLKKTVESVLAQTYKFIEYIIIDGASTDGTVQYLKEIDAMICKGERFFASAECFKFLSEPDTGIYNAMNKGIDVAKGDILYFLNAGDHLSGSDTIDFFVSKFSYYPTMSIAYGNVMLRYPDGVSVEKKFDRVSRYFLYHDTINHQSIFFRRSVFKELGPFSEKYKICSDHEKTMQIVSKGFNMRYFDKTVCFYKMDGFSSAPENFDIYMNERKTINEKHFSFSEKLFFSLWFYKKFRILLRRIGFKVYG